MNASQLPSAILHFPSRSHTPPIGEPRRHGHGLLTLIALRRPFEQIGNVTIAEPVSAIAVFTEPCVTYYSFLQSEGGSV